MKETRASGGSAGSAEPAGLAVGATNAEDIPVSGARGIRALLARRSAYAAGADLAWTTVKPGVEVKTLFISPDGVHRTVLFRLAAGARTAPHEHAELEQIYVLEGSFHDGERLLREGDMCVRAPGAVHSAFSEAGAIALGVYTALPATVTSGAGP